MEHPAQKSWTMVHSLSAPKSLPSLHIQISLHLQDQQWSYPQESGEVERDVRIIKGLLIVENPFLAMMVYWWTALQKGKALQSSWWVWRICTTIRKCFEFLQPSLPNYSSLGSKEMAMRETQKNFDEWYKAYELKPLVLVIVSGSQECKYKVWWRSSHLDHNMCLYQMGHYERITNICSLLQTHLHPLIIAWIPT